MLTRPLTSFCATSRRATGWAPQHPRCGLGPMCACWAAGQRERGAPRLLNWLSCCSLSLPQAADYTSCSPVVEAVMAADVMRSAAVLVEDMLDVLPLLLYQVCRIC